MLLLSRIRIYLQSELSTIFFTDRQTDKHIVLVECASKGSLTTMTGTEMLIILLVSFNIPYSIITPHMTAY